MIAADRASPLTPFRNGWISFGLPGVRPCDATYCVVTSELPPTPPVRYHGELGWLPPLPPDLDARMEPYRQRTGTAAMLPWLVDQTRRAGFELPAAFLRLMGSERLQHRIPSCTACFFELFERLPPCPGRERDVLIPFLVDQQTVVVWYLVLSRYVGSFVVASFADVLGLLEVEDPAGARATFVDDAVVCGRSFEEFLHRFWLENVLWYALHDGRPLTDDERRYVEFYRSVAGDPGGPAHGPGELP
jgi:hypothetical protein